jgi:hypothetical protein
MVNECQRECWVDTDYEAVDEELDHKQPALV